MYAFRLRSTRSLPVDRSHSASATAWILIREPVVLQEDNADIYVKLVDAGEPFHFDDRPCS